MDNQILAALRVELDQVVKDLDYLASNGVSASLSKDELAIMAKRAAAVRSLVARMEKTSSAGQAPDDSQAAREA